MRGSGHGAAPRAQTPITAVADRARDLHDRYATALFRQALLTLADAGLAEQVVCDVIVDECIRRPRASSEPQTARHRLAVSAYRRCQEMPEMPVSMACGRQPPPPRRPGHPVRLGSLDLGPLDLSLPERGALALVLFGGLGYVAAARAAGIPAASMAGLLRRVLLGAAESASARA